MTIGRNGNESNNLIGESLDNGLTSMRFKVFDEEEGSFNTI